MGKEGGKGEGAEGRGLSGMVKKKELLGFTLRGEGGCEGERGRKDRVKGGKEGDKRGRGGKHEHHTLLAVAPAPSSASSSMMLTRHSLRA